MTTIEKFQKFYKGYAVRQANRPMLSEQSTEEQRAAARRYSKASQRGLERFFKSLSEDERHELRDTLDRSDAFTTAILHQAEELYYL